MKPSLSVTIITKNGAKTIEKCLMSVEKLADEIIVLDSGSTDNTIEICKQYTDQVFHTDWPGYGPQKRRAVEKATSEWILSLDDDEWLSTELQNEIINTLKNPSAKLYGFPRHNMYCGHWITHGSVGKDIAIRLFKRGIATFNKKIVHEGLITNEKPHYLKSPLYHNSYLSYEALLDRLNQYTSLSAEERFNAGKKTTFKKAVVSALWAFIKAYFIRAGFLDGKIGFVVALTSAESSFYRHIKLLHLWEQQGLAANASSQLSLESD